MVAPTLTVKRRFENREKKKKIQKRGSTGAVGKKRGSELKSKYAI